jgi:hypothetical protein
VSHSSALPPAAGAQHKRNCCHAEYHHGNLRIVSIITACDAWMGAQEPWAAQDLHILMDICREQESLPA